MNYIVSPWWVYLYGAVASVDTLLLIVSILAGLALISLLIAYLICITEGELEWASRILPWLKRCATCIIAAGVVNILVPSQDTLIYMQVAKFSTPDNIESVVESAKEAVNYVVDTVKELNAP